LLSASARNDLLTRSLGSRLIESMAAEKLTSTQFREQCRYLRGSMDRSYPAVHFRLLLALLERHTTATAETANNINTIRSAALPIAKVP